MTVPSLPHIATAINQTDRIRYRQNQTDKRMRNRQNQIQTEKQTESDINRETDGMSCHPRLESKSCQSKDKRNTKKQA